MKNSKPLRRFCIQAYFDAYITAVKSNKDKFKVDVCRHEHHNSTNQRYCGLIHFVCVAANKRPVHAVSENFDVFKK
jgi:hypothetical protein